MNVPFTCMCVNVPKAFRCTATAAPLLPSHIFKLIYLIHYVCSPNKLADDREYTENLNICFENYSSEWEMKKDPERERERAPMNRYASSVCTEHTKYATKTLFLVLHE